MRVCSIAIEGRELRLTSLDRPLWPGFTKRDLISYYRSVAPAILPHLANRPVTLGRWPRGVEEPGFAQTECRGHPTWMRTEEVRLRDGETRRHCVIDCLPALLWVANQSTIELHIQRFSSARPDEPTGVVLDLDPSDEAGPAELSRAALLVRAALEREGLRSGVMSSGSAGLHVHVPLGTPHDPDRVLTFARALAAELAGSNPGLIADDRRTVPPGTVLLDWMQALPRRLTIAPYSLRATPEPAAATPLEWEEIGECPPWFSPSEVLARLRVRRDPFAWMHTAEQSLR